MDGGHDLGEEVARLGLLEPPAGPHVRVEVGRARGEDEVGLVRPHHDLVHGVDVGVAVDAVVGRKHRLLARVVRLDRLEKMESGKIGLANFENNWLGHPKKRITEKYRKLQKFFF